MSASSESIESESRQTITCEVIAAPQDLSDIKPVAVQNCSQR
jgi:hypothetical protein